MATSVTAKLGLVITAKDEASAIFKEFAAKVVESMKVITEVNKPVQESMKATSESVVSATKVVSESQKVEREEIFLTRDALLEWSRENTDAFKGVGAATNNFADVSTADMKRVYQATEEMKVGVLRDLTAIADVTDGPVITAQNKWREAVVMSANEIKTALQGIIEKDDTLANLTRLLGEENKSVWKGMYEDITGTNVVLAKTVTVERELVDQTKVLAEGFGSMAKASSLQMVGSTIDGLGTKMVGFGIQTIKAGAGFEKAVDSIAATLNERLTPATQLSAEQVDALGQKALDLGKSGLFSANELADSMYVMSKQGVGYTAIMGGAIKTVQDVAGATDSSLKDTANVMTDILNEFGPSVTQFGTTAEEQFGKVGDLISGAMHNARMSMTEFLDTLKYVGPLAGGLGLPLTDVATGLSLLAKAGIKGTNAGTMLRSMLSNLPGATKPAREEMKKLGIITKDGANQFFDAQGKVKSLADIHDILRKSMENLTPVQEAVAIKTMFGMRSMGGMEAILHTTDGELNTLTGDVTRNGSAHDLAAAKMDNAAGKLKILASNFETLQKEIGIMLLPVVEKLVLVGQGLIDWFDNLGKPMQNSIVVFGMLAGATLLLSGRIMNTVAMFQFFRIALGDLIAKAVPATIATGELTIATDASAVAAGEATIAREGLNVATGTTSIVAGEAVIATEGLAGATGAATIAVDGAAASTGILGGAFAFLLSPVVLTIAAIAAVGVAAVELYKHFTPFHDAVDNMVGSFKKLGAEVKTAFWGEDYAAKVEAMSNKSVASVVTMSNSTLVKLEELKIKGGAISQSTADDVVRTSQAMTDKVVATAESRYTEEIAAATKLHDQQHVISDDTYKEMIATAESQKKGTIANTQEMNKKVSDEIAAMSKAGIKVTDEMKTKLTKDFQLMAQSAVSDLSEGEIQQKAVLELLRRDHGNISKEIAQQTLKDAATARDGAVNAENSKYKDTIATIIRNRDVLHSLTAAQASDAIGVATGQHTDTLKQINGTFNDTKAALQSQRPQLVNEMNTTTGAMLTSWEVFSHGVGNVLSGIGASISGWVSGQVGKINTLNNLGNVPTSTRRMGGMQQNAQGSDFFDGGSTWVGEDGPELITPPNGSKITPHQTSMNKMVNMGGSNSSSSGRKTHIENININISGVGKGGSQLGEDIAKQLRLQIAMVN